MKEIVISDIHLGSDLCRAKELRKFLDGLVDVDHLILNGDVFDSHDFRRLRKCHWGVLSDLRKISKNTEVIWVSGNHDGPAETLAHLIGVEAVDEYVLFSGGKNILFLHGDRFDDFIVNHPILTWFSDVVYWGIQMINHRLARHLKRNSKTYLRCADLIKEKAIRHCLKSGCDIVCCGHSHRAESCGNYFNSGCWTENPCSYLEIEGGLVNLHNFPYV